MKTLLIISHTEHYKSEDGKYLGWGPTITEVNYFSNLFHKVYHAAPLHVKKPPKSSLPYKNNVEYIPLKPAGGNLIAKLNIFWNAPYNLWQIQKAIKKIDVIQFRAPTGIGIYVLPYLKYLNNKPYWIKYAGNWKSDNFPWANFIQKWWLQKAVSLKTKVTVNGKWENEKENIIAFENPCLKEEDRIYGNEIIKTKALPKQIQLCFVGGLNENKGIKNLILALIELNSNAIEKLHIVGDGQLKPELETLAKQSNIPVVFYGFLPKNKILEIYKESHFLVLPSKSEGFPKVVGEAMNYGCIPIVSDVSCISQYIKSNNNGFLIFPITTDEIKKQLSLSLSLSNRQFAGIIKKNYMLAHKFTYEYFLQRIEKEILKKK